LDRLAFDASGAGITSSDKTVGISADVLRNLTQDEHPILQNIMQVTAGWDFRVTPTPNSVGQLYAGLLKATKAPLREEMLVALLRPADWSSFNPHQPLTFDVLDSFDCAVAQVKSLLGTHLMVKVVKVVNLGTGTQSVAHAVRGPHHMSLRAFWDLRACIWSLLLGYVNFWDGTVVFALSLTIWIHLLTRCFCRNHLHPLPMPLVNNLDLMVWAGFLVITGRVKCWAEW
jgi:hypothetical protein